MYSSRIFFWQISNSVKLKIDKFQHRISPRKKTGVKCAECARVEEELWGIIQENDVSSSCMKSPVQFVVEKSVDDTQT